MKSVGTIFRLERCASVFEPSGSERRKLVPAVAGVASASALALDGWEESSLGDAMHKLVLVRSGEVDLEGCSGGWVILPNHLVFIPAERAFAFRAAPGTILHVAHLEPAACRWHHEGCWAMRAPPLAREMLDHAVRWTAEDTRHRDSARHFFTALSHLCGDWFSEPRILWLPSARTAAMRSVLGYLRDHLADATLDGACAASGLTSRTLQRRCQEELHFGWRELLREARILRAMEMLAEGARSVGAVAESVGFASLSAFTSAFSRRVGLSPTEFARNHGGAPFAAGRNPG